MSLETNGMASQPPPDPEFGHTQKNKNKDRMIPFL